MSSEFLISEELTAQFRVWSRDVLKFEDDHVDPDNPDWSVLETADYSALDQRGLELAQALKRELPHCEVHYGSSQNEDHICN